MANYIGNAPVSGEFKHLDSIASQFNGSTTTFSLLFNGVSQSVGDASQLIVSLNGVVQEPLTAYTLGTGGSTAIFSSAPASGSTCFIVKLGGVGGTTTPSDNSVTTAKIAPGAVTSAKLDTNIAVSGTTNIGSYVGSVVNSPLDIKADTSHFGLSIEENSGTETWQLGVDVDGDLNFHNSGSATPSVTFNDAGNVGIGTTSPNTTLTLSDGTDEFDFGVTANLLMIKSVTSDGSDDHRIIIDAGNGGLSSTRGAYVALSGNEASTNPGQAVYQMGNVTGSSHLFRRAGGHDAVIINSSGNVGIGTITPDAPLTLINSVTDAYTPSSFNNKPSITIKSQDGTNNYSGIRFTNTTGGYEFMFGSVQTATSNDYADMVLQGYDWGATTYKEYLRVKNNGNVGIGTSSPNQWASYTDNAATVLQVKDSSQRARIVINGGDGAHLDLVDYAGASNDKHMNMAVDGGILKFGSLNDAGNAFVKNNIMVMDLGSGNVGIGTASPADKMHIYNSSGTTVYRADVNANSTVGFEINKTGSTTQSWKIADGITHNGALQFYDATNSAVRMHLKSDGLLGIGTTSPLGTLHLHSADTALRLTSSQGSNTPLAQLQYSGSGGYFLRLGDSSNNEDVMIRTYGNSHFNGGNVGIGTTSPSAPIDVVTSSVTYAAEFTQSNTSNGDGVFISVGSTAAADYALTVRSDAGNTSVLAAKADGKVGIGVFSPFADLTVGTSTAFDNGDNYISAVFQPAIIGGESAGMLFGHYPASGYAKQGIFWERYTGSSGSGGRGKLHFVNRDATDTSVPTIADTRMTIDEAGSVLVGKTSTNSDTVGVEALPAGQVYITANNTLPFYINRKGTSGNNEFARFSDDGATRGTIASSFQEELTISASGTNSSGILFSQSNQVRPMKNGSTSSGTQDLGAGNGRWKDIYLSGGIDFGNAASTDTGGESNLLDDYETGTWTPKLKDLNGNEASAYQTGYPKGTYVKIGSHVWVNFSIRITNKGSMTGNYVHIANLPFNKDSTTEGRGTGTIDYYSGLAATKSYLALDTSSTVSVFWLVGGTNATGSHYVTTAHLNNTCMFKGGGNYRAT